MGPPPRVCAVSYLNTSPLVWGFLHGPQRNRIELSFALPSECAERLRAGEADIGLPPSIEVARQDTLAAIPGCSISSRGPAGSVLLVCRRPIEDVESLAADTGSRSSVALAQILLARKYQRRVTVRPHPPQVDEMLEAADAALIIGDRALRLAESGAGTGRRVYDLGEEWWNWTGLPMVFAVWAVRRDFPEAELAPLFQASAEFGLERLAEIAAAEAPARGLPVELAHRYLTSNLYYGWGEEEARGLRLFLEHAAGLGLAPARPIEILKTPALAAP